MKANNPNPAQRQGTLSLLDRARQQTESKIWKPEKVGSGIEGTVVQIARGVGKFNSDFYHLRTPDGVVIVAAGQTVLGRKIAELGVGVGDQLAVLYLGEAVTKSGTRYKNWSVVCEKLPSANSKSSAVADSDDDVKFSIPVMKQAPQDDRGRVPVLELKCPNCRTVCQAVEAQNSDFNPTIVSCPGCGYSEINNSKNSRE